MAQKAQVTGYPRYTLEKIHEKGLDLAKEPSCNPTPYESGNRAVVGCSCHENCRFNRPPYGTFKGKGPQRVAYYYKTIEGRENTNDMPCWQFINVMQGPMDQAIASELRGDTNHEIVRIIAHEGETYSKIVTKMLPPKKDGTPNWDTQLVKVTLKPMGEESVDVYAEYRKQLADEYASGVPLAQSEDSEESAEDETDAPTVQPGKPVARPAWKHGYSRTS